jgi:hypothetical protein
MEILGNMSDAISCATINALNDNFNKYNDIMFQSYIICPTTDNNNDDNYRINPKYLNSAFIDKKTCIFKSTEPDEMKWAEVFNYGPSYEMKDDNTKINFNENTRQKLIFNPR